MASNTEEEDYFQQFKDNEWFRFPAKIEAKLNQSCLEQLSKQPKPPGLYCPGMFDTWVCWNDTPANSDAFHPCPDFISGFDPKLVAHKTCMPDGTWFSINGSSWSNYTTCVIGGEFGPVRVQLIGNSLSLIALVISLCILGYFKNLRCPRITVHMNLFASFAINSALWLMWYNHIQYDQDILNENPGWCRAIRSIMDYFVMTNYSWMLCEGLYLHTVLVSAFISEFKLLRVLLAIGWAVPLLFAMLYAGLRTGSVWDNLCWMDLPDWTSIRSIILWLPSLLTVVLNLIFLFNIVRVLCTKLRAPQHMNISNPRPTATALHAFRATCLLLPLLGLQFLLTPFDPPVDSSWRNTYDYIVGTITSFQGLCVATLFCFFNGEVMAQMKRKWRTMMFRPRTNSCSATTVSLIKLTRAFRRGSSFSLRSDITCGHTAIFPPLPTNRSNFVRSAAAAAPLNQEEKL